MKTKLYHVLFLWLGLSIAALAQNEPSITVPVDGATGVAFTSPSITIASSSTGNDIADPDFLTVQICDAASFSGFTFFWEYTPEVERDNDTPDSYVVTGPVLSPGTTYFIRAYSVKYDVYGPIGSFTTTSVPVTGTTRVSTISGITTNTVAASLTCYPNRRSLSFNLLGAIPNATQYVIQLDTTSSTFANVVDSIIINSTSTGMRVDVGWLMASRISGSTTFVRVRGINSTSRGPWGTGTNIRKFAFPLQPCSLVSPSGTINRNSFKLWTNRVGRGQRFYFQVDDNSNFSSPVTLTGGFASRNETVSGITGNVFRHNYEVGGNGRAFDYLTQTVNNTTYFVRVRAWNATHAAQSAPGYWADTITITPTPTLTAAFTQPVNLATNQATGYNFILRDDPNFTESSYDIQVATDAGFTSLINNVTGLTARNYFVSNLNFSTTYFARVRSIVTSPALTSAWAVVQFTTKANPTLSVTFPTPSVVWNNNRVHAYSTWEAGVTEYQWEVEKLTPPTSSQTFTSTGVGRNFDTYLVQGNSYRIRVRGFAGAQTITGPYSAWVNFSLSPPALPVVNGPAKVLEQSARFGEFKSTEPVAYPNPFTNTLVLALPQGAQSYSVTDLSGREVVTNASAMAVQEVGGTWAKGTYLVRVQTSEGAIKHLKVLKQ